MNLIQTVLCVLDPRLRGQFLRELSDEGSPLRWRGRLVLAGHRSAGKSALLPAFAAASGRPALDLDRQLEATYLAPILDWFPVDPGSFRAAERAGFEETPAHAAVAVGGGFLAHHADLLEDDTVVLVPLSLATYCERLQRDRSRPRLQPHRSLTEELAHTWHTREAEHRRFPTVPLGKAVRALTGPEMRDAWSAW
ncbi:MAG: shikimate kinase [Archangiaceae bacterium]|nr:shikimate kinase [Archangiaceae bacterium]